MRHQNDQLVSNITVGLDWYSLYHSVCLSRLAVKATMGETKMTEPRLEQIKVAQDKPDWLLTDKEMITAIDCTPGWFEDHHTGYEAVCKAQLAKAAKKYSDIKYHNEAKIKQQLEEQVGELHSKVNEFLMDHYLVKSGCAYRINRDDRNELDAIFGKPPVKFDEEIKLSYELNLPIEKQLEDEREKIGDAFKG